jgi:hypothetical protein
MIGVETHMADTSDPKKTKKDDEPPASVPLPESEKLSGCSTAGGIVVAIFVLLLIAGFGLFVGACWR